MAATNTPKPVKLRWKMQPRERGLSAVGAGPRAHVYRDAQGVHYATVYPDGGGWSPLRGWYWVAGWDSDVPYCNTCYELCETVEQAKAQAVQYIKQHLQKQQDDSNAN